MLKMAPDIAPLFQTMDWTFAMADRQYAFITSDNPFLLLPARKIDPFMGVGLMTPGARKIIPLRSDMCLVMTEICEEPQIRFQDVGKEFFREVNRVLMANAERFCFSAELGKLEKLVKDVKPYSLIRLPRMRVS